MPAGAATLTVTNTADSGAGTLRNLVGSASAGDTIKFTNTLSGQIITLISGQIVLSNNVTIDGSALTNQIVLNGNHASRLFTVTNATVLLDSLTLTNGFADTDNNAHGDIPSNRGGGIYNYGNLIVNRCTFAGNHSSHGGGAINAIAGSLTVSNSTFYNNNAGYGGGAIINYAPATMNQCTVVSNSATAYPGGLFGFAGTLTLKNSIVAANFSPPGNGDQNLQGTVITSGANLISGDPKLAPLGNYGGSTPTMPPLPGSPAIDGCTSGTSLPPTSAACRASSAPTRTSARWSFRHCWPLRLRAGNRCSPGPPTSRATFCRAPPIWLRPPGGL